MRAFNSVLLSMIAVASIAGCSTDDMGNYNTQSGSSGSTVSTDYNQNGSYMTDTSAGSLMTSPQGMTVYTFDKDQPGTSACYGDCAMKWPPVIASADAQEFGEMTLITRTDGQRQWAYDGKPLYTYHEDAAAGDVKGDNVGGVWHVVK
jgi:predicted lipoprotein with Yx(FWY)xxD motif